MIVMRGAMLLGAAWAVLVGFGAAGPEAQPSALRLWTAAVIALLAPLFWPGGGGVARLLGWSAAACGMAALLMLVLTVGRQPPAAVLQSCAMLGAILLVSHAATLGLERRWSRDAADATAARERAGRSVALALVLLGSLPLWLGPAAEMLSARHERAIDALFHLSPLVHLAVASGNDLLRNQWLYQHSNLASLQFDYPALAGLGWFYVSIGSLLGLLAWARRGRAYLPTERTR